LGEESEEVAESVTEVEKKYSGNTVEINSATLREIQLK
jgi:hypothetical protein